MGFGTGTESWDAFLLVLLMPKCRAKVGESDCLVQICGKDSGVGRQGRQETYLRPDEGIKSGVMLDCRGEKRKKKIKRRQDWSGKEMRHGEEEEETETGRQKKQWLEVALSNQELWVQQGKALLK